MGKRIHSAATNAWQRFLFLDRQISRTASDLADVSLDEPRAVASMPDYAAVKAFADSSARIAGY